VAADVFAIVPNDFIQRLRPIGLGLSSAKYPAGSEQTVLVPATPVYAAIAEYVFFVIGVLSVYSNSGCVIV
jgi:hypothetical protein